MFPVSSAFNWRSAWDEIADDDPHFAGREFYELPVEHPPHRIYEGDRFWQPDERIIIEVDDVKTKVYRGVVGPKGEEGNDCVFYTPDWEPPENPHRPNHYTDDIHFMPVEDFAERIDEGDLVPHRGNGLPRRPPY